MSAVTFGDAGAHFVGGVCEMPDVDGEEAGLSRNQEQRDSALLRMRDSYRNIVRRELGEFFDIDMENPVERRTFQDDFRRFRETRVFWSGIKEKSWAAAAVALISFAVSYLASHWKN